MNAALLFSVEPMFSKLLLPFLGGTPSVWNTCLVFFQAALLIGYGYAHLLTRVRDPRRQTGLHLAMLTLSCFALPLSIRASGDPPAGGAGILWLLAVLTASLGAPFVMLASGAPIMQRWLADSSHHAAANPYFLYAASNLGSLVALLSYPLLIEPRLSLSAQRAAWSAAYGVLVLLVAACSLIVVRDKSRYVGDSRPIPAPAIRPLDRARWVLYSAVPASLLVGVTTFISTDVAAVPLLWVLPLSIYLLTFVLVFATRPPLPHKWMERAEPHVLVIVFIPIFWSLPLPGLIGIAAHLIVLFVVSMVCHGELAHRRPPPSQLTEFFVWVAAGGLIGGVFTALVAPVVFNQIYEYPIALAVAGMLRQARSADSRFRPSDIVVALGIAASLLLVTLDVGTLPDPIGLLVTMIFSVLIFSFRDRPLRFGLTLAAVFVAGQVREAFGADRSAILDSERSFFGVYRVARNPSSNVVTLQHGTTLHGAQSVIPGRRLEPLTYYHRAGPVGDVFVRTPAALRKNRKVGVVGLGAGSLACYGRQGERWTYYEIDPVVARIALDPRLTLGKARGTKFDILVLDAFSSDAIPIHLLTREALRGYFALLAPGGVIAMHISNQHLDLEPVVAATAAESGVTARLRRDVQIPPSDAAAGRSQSLWVVLARAETDLGTLVEDRRWQPLRRRSDVGAWTDDFSNIIRVFDWH